MSQTIWHKPRVSWMLLGALVCAGSMVGDGHGVARAQSVRTCGVTPRLSVYESNITYPTKDSGKMIIAYNVVASNYNTTLCQLNLEIGPISDPNAPPSGQCTSGTAVTGSLEYTLTEAGPVAENGLQNWVLVVVSNSCPAGSSAFVQLDLVLRTVDLISGIPNTPVVVIPITEKFGTPATDGG